MDPRARPRPRIPPLRGNYSTYLEKKAERVAVQGRKDVKLQKRLQEELAWVRSGAKARQAKSKARLGRYEEMAAEAEKTRKLDFEEIQIPTGPRLGNVVVEVSHLDKGFDGRQLIKDLSFTLPRNGIVGGVIGPNGVGKTTLFKTIVGLEEPDSGTVKVGETVKLSYVDQNRGGIDPPKKTVWEVVSDGLDFIEVGQNEMPSRAYVSAFGFKGPRSAEAGRRAVRRRAQPAEPCADPQRGRQPDPARRADQRPGRRNAELAGERAGEVPPRLRGGHQPRPLVPRPHLHPHPGVGRRQRQRGQVFWFEGNFGGYEENKVERLGAEAARPPHRVTHRKLTRGG